MQQYQKQLQQWLKNGEPDIIIYMNVSTAQETIDRLHRFPDACDDDYIGTLIEILEKEINDYYNQSKQTEPNF